MSARIKSIIGEETKSAFGARTGIDPKTLSPFVHGKSIPGGLNLVKIVENTGVNGHWLLTGEGPMLRRDLVARPPSGREVTRVPFLSVGADHSAHGRAAAGAPGEAGEGGHRHEPLSFPAAWIPDVSACRCVEVTGDSMEPEIRDASVVVVDMSAGDVGKLKGELVVVSLPCKQGMVVKRFRVTTTHLTFESANARYGDHVFRRDAIHPNMVLGRVVAVRDPDGTMRQV